MQRALILVILTAALFGGIATEHIVVANTQQPGKKLEDGTVISLRSDALPKCSGLQQTVVVEPTPSERLWSYDGGASAAGKPAYTVILFWEITICNVEFADDGISFGTEFYLHLKEHDDVSGNIFQETDYHVMTSVVQAVAQERDLTVASFGYKTIKMFERPSAATCHFDASAHPSIEIQPGKAARPGECVVSLTVDETFSIIAIQAKVLQDSLAANDATQIWTNFESLASAQRFACEKVRNIRKDPAFAGFYISTDLKCFTAFVIGLVRN